MRFQPGILLCLLAGCAVQPTPAGTIAALDASNRDTLHRLADGNAMRLGVEFLPPPADEQSVAVRPAAARAQSVPNRTEPPVRRPNPTEFDALRQRRTNAEHHTWMLSSDDLAAMQTATGRETLQFVEDLLQTDQSRIGMGRGTPILDVATVDLQSPELRLPELDPETAALAEWRNQNGMSLLRRPSNRLLRRLPVVQDVQMEVEDFSSDHVPLTRSYRRTHEDERSLGRVSLRVRAGDWSDPLEFSYMRSGARIATSQQHLKLGLQRSLGDALVIDLQSQIQYDTSDWHAQLDLGWILSPQTTLHLLVSDQLDFLATSAQHALYETPLDGSPGLLFYAVYRF